MSLPESVRRAEEAANAFYANLEKQRSASAAAGVTPESGTPQEGSAEPAKTEGEAPAPTPTPQAEEFVPKHKHDVLLGKYNSEVPRLSAQLREATERIKALENEVKSVATKPQAEPLVKQEEVQEYGESLTDFMRRVAREETAAVRSEVESVKGQVQSAAVNSAKDAEVAFYETLAAKVPDWSIINDDPAFHAWLSEVDGFTGKTRQMLLIDAEAARDASRVINFFKSFAKVSNSRAAAASKAEEEQVVPAKGSPNGAPPAKQFYNRKGIERFYADWRSGKVPQKDAIAIEADIQLAIQEGRVR